MYVTLSTMQFSEYITYICLCVRARVWARARVCVSLNPVNQGY